MRSKIIQRHKKHDYPIRVVEITNKGQDNVVLRGDVSLLADQIDDSCTVNYSGWAAGYKKAISVKCLSISRVIPYSVSVRK